MERIYPPETFVTPIDLHRGGWEQVRPMRFRDTREMVLQLDFFTTPINVPRGDMAENPVFPYLVSGYYGICFPIVSPVARFVEGRV